MQILPRSPPTFPVLLHRRIQDRDELCGSGLDSLANSVSLASSSPSGCAIGGDSIRGRKTFNTLKNPTPKMKARPTNSPTMIKVFKTPPVQFAVLRRVFFSSVNYPQP